ncbi:MAG: hypothetical protein PWP43_832, partial [Bacillota bacterium]|nr:hypothetical protein [Bacillota bacterium]
MLGGGGKMLTQPAYLGYLGPEGTFSE